MAVIIGIAYSSHLSASGKCPGAQSAFIRAGADQHGSDNRTHDDLFAYRILKSAQKKKNQRNGIKQNRVFSNGIARSGWMWRIPFLLPPAMGIS